MEIIQNDFNLEKYIRINTNDSPKYQNAKNIYLGIL